MSDDAVPSEAVGGAAAGSGAAGSGAAGSGLEQEGWIAALGDALGGPDARSLASEFAARVSTSYLERTAVAQAVLDLRALADLEAAPATAGAPYRADPREPRRFAVGPDAGPSVDTGAGMFRLRRYGRRSVELSRLLPLVESFGLVVIEAVPHEIRALGGSPAAHIDDVRLRSASPQAGDVFDVDRDGVRLVAAIEAVARGRADLDSLNRLIFGAGLDWQEVALLRTYRRYRRQTGVAMSDAQLDEPLVAWPEVTRRLISYARARFGPVAGGGAEAARAGVVDALAEVAAFEQDQVLRGYLALIDATLRTNWLVRGVDGAPRPTIVVKLRSSLVPGLAPPLPEIETWVHGPEVEGIHLRNGLIARGGIRWSERAEDFRAEVLGLAEAQIKKNAIIVPTGAKGGFVVRSRTGGVASDGGGGLGDPGPVRIESAYRLFIESLLDITDNLVDAVVVPPAGIAIHDGDDPYLVVAADRGTATFSDVANEISARHEFWLGDAFASGGSHGYDHKAMAITAKGAWVAVRRHFHQLGVDVATETIRVTGVGDLSGDVFGNGMLRSEAIALVAAFDHRHVFIDPDPDPARSFAERTRMTGLGRSTWDDYDRSVLSPGGGVWRRDAKTIPLSTEARRALGITDAELPPPEVISAILRAPVDLLFFGGIGTYIKGPGESDVEVADRADDAVRVTADEVRARVIAEGGNLAITQRGRIRYSRRGGRINTDFIDNAAGVATSDREVNLKILLALAISAGRILPEQRDELLASAEGEVTVEVLRQVDRSVAALNRAVPLSAAELDAHEALLEHLEAAGTLDRRVEHLPSVEEFGLRRTAGAGLIRPELAVLLAYAKSDLVAAIEDSALVRDGTLADAVVGYFPPTFRALGEDLPARHRLAPQLAATALAGSLVDQMGIAWAHETAAELGRSPVDVAAAFWAARLVLDAGSLWQAIEDAGDQLPADVEADAHGRVVAAVAALARRYLTARVRPDPRALCATDHEVAELIAAAHQAAEAGPTAPDGTPSPERVLPPAGMPGPLAGLGTRLAALDAATYVADARAVSHSVGLSLPLVLEAFSAMDVAVAPGLIKRLEAVRSTSRWSSWQARALIDDLVAWRPRAVAEALRAAVPLEHTGTVNPPGAVDLPGAVDPSGAVGAWVAVHRDALKRVDALIGLLDPERDDVLDVAALLVRALAATA